MKQRNATLPNIGGKQPHPQHLLRKIKLELFLHCSKEHQNMRALDHAFILLRMTPARLFSVEFWRNVPQKMPRNCQISVKQI